MSGIRIVLYVLFAFATALAMAETHDSAPDAAPSVLSVQAPGSGGSSEDSNAFNYKLALEELEAQVRAGNLPPEAVSQIMDQISPILDRLDQEGQGTQDIEVVRSALAPNDVKVLIRPKNAQATTQAETTSDLPPIPSQSSSQTPGTGNPATTQTQPMNAQGLPMALIPMYPAGAMTLPASKKFQEFAGLLAEAQTKAAVSGKGIKVVNSGSAAGSSAGGSSATGTGAASETESQVAALTAMELELRRNGSAAPASAKESKVRGFIQGVVSKFASAGKQASQEKQRQVASHKDAASALEVPHLSSQALEIAGPTQAETAGELAASPISSTDTTSWVFGSLMSLLAMRAAYQWRKRLSWRKR